MTHNPQYPVAVTVKRGASGMYTARSQFGSTRGGYIYDNVSIGDTEEQAARHARKHADKFFKPGRRIVTASMPDGKSCVAIVMPEIDPALQLHISATYHYPRGQAYGLHRVRVTRLNASGHWETLVDAEGTGGNGQHYETAYLALVMRGHIPPCDGPHGSLYWRETLEAKDNGYTEVSRRKDM